MVYDTNRIAHQDSGFVTLKLATNAAFSGKLLLDGDSASFTGKMNPQGTASVTVKRLQLGKENLRLNLAFDLSGGSDRLTGVVSNSSILAELQADRKIWTTNNPATAFTNYHTMLLPGFDNMDDGPTGYGYAAVTVLPNGAVKMAGLTADNHTWKQSTFLSKNGEWPLYMAAYKTLRIFTNLTVTTSTKLVTNKNYCIGSTLGWLAFTNQHPVGNVSWINGGWTNEFYSDGFTNVTGIVSSLYTPPARGVRALDVTNGTVKIEDGNLSAAILRNFVLGTNNVLSITPTNQTVRISLSAKTGIWKGSFVNIDNTNAVTVTRGALLQDQIFGGGFFIGTNKTGKVSLLGN